MDAEQFEAKVYIAAKALWESRPHKLLEAGGWPLAWDEQCKAVQKDYIDDARLVVKTFLAQD